MGLNFPSNMSPTGQDLFINGLKNRYLLKQVGREQGEYRLGIYPFKKIYDELKLVKVGKSEMIDERLLKRYEGILTEIFRDLFDLEKPFEQTEEEKNCQYCPYPNP